METPDRNLTIFYTGSIKAGVHTTIKALDERVPFCANKDRCMEHRAQGEHINAALPNYMEEFELTLERGHLTYRLDIKAGQQKGTLAGLITTLLDVGPMINRELEWLRGCDAIVFVVDSRTAVVRMSEVRLRTLREDLVAAGRDPDMIPLVFQLNKRDLANYPDPDQRALPVSQIEEKLRWPGAKYIESVANQRIGVFEALGEVLDLYESRQPKN